MSNLRKFLIVIPILFLILACQAISRPIQGVEGAAQTAAAIATQAESLITQIPDFTTEISPLQTAIPDIPGNVFNPQSPPLADWNGIPVMQQATAGDEVSGLYTYKVTASGQDVKDFYSTKMAALGWDESFSMPMEGSSILLYTKGDQVLSITILPSDTDGESIVTLALQ